MSGTIPRREGEFFADCPFCAAPGAQLVELHDDGDCVHARCLHCAADGPLVPKSPRTATAPERAARLRWNMRKIATPIGPAIPAEVIEQRRSEERAAVDRIGAGAEHARIVAERLDLLVLVHGLLSELANLKRPGAQLFARTAGAWWPFGQVTAETAARAWLDSKGLS